MVESRTFPAEPQSAALARRFVLDVLVDVTTDHFAAELLVGELATNAIEHAESPFSVSVDVQASVVRIEITNDAPELLAVVTEHPSSAGGFGLRIVDELSQHWGI